MQLTVLIKRILLIFCCGFFYATAGDGAQPEAEDEKRAATFERGAEFPSGGTPLDEQIEGGEDDLLLRSGLAEIYAHSQFSRVSQEVFEKMRSKYGGAFDVDVDQEINSGEPFRYEYMVELISALNKIKAEMMGCPVEPEDGSDEIVHTSFLISGLAAIHAHGQISQVSQTVFLKMYSEYGVVFLEELGQGRGLEGRLYRIYMSELIVELNKIKVEFVRSSIINPIRDQESDEQHD